MHCSPLWEVLILSDLIAVIDSRGRTLTPCRRKVAEREVRLDRAKWIGRNKIRLRFDPFAYRYVRLKVLARDNYTCYWCGGPGDTMDHVIPWSKGGRTTMTNCICACSMCNGERGDMPAEEYARIKNVPAPEGESFAVRAATAGAAPAAAAAALAPKSAPEPALRALPQPVSAPGPGLWLLLDPMMPAVHPRTLK